MEFHKENTPPFCSLHCFELGRDHLGCREGFSCPLLTPQRQLAAAWLCFIPQRSILISGGL